MAKYAQNPSGRSPADWLVFAAAFLIFLGLGFWAIPNLLYAEKAQPFEFSHQVHLKQADGCKTCHYLRDDGSFSGLPGLETCKECHSDQPMGETPAEKKFVEDYLVPGKPIPWLVYAKQPNCVFFSHAAHTKSAGLECEKCHGNHGKSNKLPPYEYNWISTYSRNIWGKNILGLGGPPDRMKMDDCAKCHRENGVRDACFVCHK